MPAAARKGDKCVPHCSPFNIKGASTTVFVNNKGASRVGDPVVPHKEGGGAAGAAGTAASIGAKFAPPPYSVALAVVGKLKKCKNHAPSIEAGSSSVFINGKAAAFVGSSITGCTSVAAGSADVFVGR
jgi:uncharacterized Zn-binding protein involved in type VI secretion